MIRLYNILPKFRLHLKKAAKTKPPQKTEEKKEKVRKQGHELTNRCVAQSCEKTNGGRTDGHPHLEVPGRI